MALDEVSRNYVKESFQETCLYFLIVKSCNKMVTNFVKIKIVNK